MGTKVCTKCKQEKPLTSFGTRTVSGKKYPTTRCYTCKATTEKERGWRKHETIAAFRIRKNQKRREVRKIDIVRTIYDDTKQADQKKGRSNNLDKSFIESLITKPCSYCGETKLRMTLDRIDNEVGHTKDNVVQACYRCNYTRGNMPYRAWMYLVDGMKRARLDEVFDNWASEPISRK